MTTEADVVVYKDKPLKHLNRIAKKPTLDIQFQDLKYSIRDSQERKGWRQILHSVSGEFRCGEFTAILGPSGSGKTTLLNILAGYICSGTEGSITINSTPRNMKTFKKMSSYIMQEDIIQPRLTVREALMYAANLKLGVEISQPDKLAVIAEVMNILCLESCADTRSEYLSGGERRRLSVALELVNNPPVIFLDEPTTGLDNYAIKQCIDLLKKISRLDRTVICTIHQPPASLLQCFDQIYVVADGYCVYNGSPSQMLTFFSSVGETCPSSYTPPDFIIELVHSNPAAVTRFSEAIENGKINMRGTAESGTCLQAFEEEDVYREVTQVAVRQRDIEFATPFRVQFAVLICRVFKQMARNRIMLSLYLFQHLLIGFAMGGLFAGIGNDASQTIAMFKYCICCMVFFPYTYIFTSVLLLPFEFKLLKREYFNRWYSLKTYYSVLTVSTLPLMISQGIMFCAIIYFLADHPADRFLGFCLINLASALTAQGIGFMIGSVFDLTGGSLMGVLVFSVNLVLSIYGMGYKIEYVSPFYKYAMKLMFIRNGVEGLCDVLFYKREPLECNDIYCHYARPEVMMQDMAASVMDYKYHLGYLIIFMILFRILAYYVLKCRLNVELSSKIDFYVKKFLTYNYLRLRLTNT